MAGGFFLSEKFYIIINSLFYGGTTMNKGTVKWFNAEKG